MGNEFNLSNIFNKGGSDNKEASYRKYLMIALILGVGLMLIGDLFIPDKPDSNESIREKSTIASRDITPEEEIEERLKAILSKVQGSGRVDVKVTLDNSGNYTYARNYHDSNQDVSEEDSSGGIRSTNQYDNRREVIVLSQGGEERALVKREVKPEIRGVMVVAEGANDSRIKSDLFNAVRVGLGVPSHKITILSKER
ncbi:hypothetical protein [Halonatronum saccharophilum]|uniref:hypothetical protein n=1 Tax=Halonatronum saccharophilum TaxID=150060 RepID=UPI0004AE7A81|nr:hypothetical protein [Halonatronum saccharophilum]